MSKDKDHKSIRVWHQQGGGLGGPSALPSQKTIKTINKQLQNNENSSGKSLDYHEKAAEILWSSNTKDGHIGKHRMQFSLCSPTLWYRAAQCQEEPLGGVSPQGERRAEEPQQAPLWMLAAFATEDPQSLLMLNPADRAAQSASCCFFSPGLEQSQWWDLSPGAPVAAVPHSLGSVHHRASLSMRLLLCTLLSSPKSQLWPTITRAALLLLCILLPGSRHTALWAITGAVLLQLCNCPLGPKLQLCLTITGLPLLLFCNCTLGPELGLWPTIPKVCWHCTLTPAPKPLLHLVITGCMPFLLLLSPTPGSSHCSKLETLRLQFCRRSAQTLTSDTSATTAANTPVPPNPGTMVVPCAADPSLALLPLYVPVC